MRAWIFTFNATPTVRCMHGSKSVCIRLPTQIICCLRCAGFTSDGSYFQPNFLTMESPWLVAIKEVRPSLLSIFDVDVVTAMFGEHTDKLASDRLVHLNCTAFVSMTTCHWCVRYVTGSHAADCWLTVCCGPWESSPRMHPLACPPTLRICCHAEKVACRCDHTSCTVTLTALGLLQVLPINAHDGEEQWAWPQGSDQASLTATPGTRSAALQSEGASQPACSARCVTGAIVGTGCGALLLLVAAVALVAWLRRRRQRNMEVEGQVGSTKDVEDALGSNHMKQGLCSTVRFSMRNMYSFRLATQLG